jgi:hypothetical protein
MIVTLPPHLVTANSAVTLPGIDALPEDCAPETNALFDHWRSIHPPGGGLPGRQHFDPAKVPQLLRNIWLVDVARAPCRFRVRLLGTAIVEFVGSDDTGKWLHEIYGDFEGSEPHRCMCTCARDGRPAFQKSNIQSNPEKSYVIAERLYLPLAADGHTPDMLLNMTLYRR